MEHGTLGAYTSGKCRCDPCRKAMRDYHRERRSDSLTSLDRDALGDLLAELFPDGLTNDCPARKSRRSRHAQCA